MSKLKDRLAHAWNAFTTQDIGANAYGRSGITSFSSRPDRARLTFTNERSMLASIYTRIALDVSAIDIRHVRTDTQGRYVDDVVSGLNYCLTTEANVDQAATAFKLDVVLSLFDKGYIAIVPVDTTINPAVSGSYDIKTMRVGYITEWFPRKVRVSVYDDRERDLSGFSGGGVRREIVLDKTIVAIVENPLYLVMNEPNSTLKRLINKLNLLDIVDEAASSGKLDLIIQLPYTVRSEVRKQQAEQRGKDVAAQLEGSKYGIAYIDGTEKVTQLNRPVENNLLKQVEMLIEMLYVQLGLTPDVMNGTADEKTMLNYNARTVEPIVKAIVEAMRRSFLTKTARSQGQDLMYFRDPFKLVPIEAIAKVTDVLSRNEILTPNEIRQAIGFRPAKDPSADKLQNSNMSNKDNTPPAPSEPVSQDQNNTGTGGDSQNGT